MSTKSTVWNVSKYGVFSGPYFPAFGMNLVKKKTRYLDIFHAVKDIHTQTNVQLKVAVLFKYVWPFSGERLNGLLLSAYQATETISSSLSFL